MTQSPPMPSQGEKGSGVAKLIERLELAGGRDRKLDLAISVAINFKGVFDPAYDWRWAPCDDEIEGWKDGKRIAFLDPKQFVPRWTESIDVALMLVPNGRRGFVGFGGNQLAGTWVMDGPQIYGRHKVPAIALTLAALKARQATGERG